MSVAVHHKQPSEHYSLAMEFAGKLPAGTALASGVCVALDKNNVDVSAIILTGPCAVSGTQLQQVIQAGTAGESYMLKYSATLTPGSSVLDEWVQLVIEQVNIVTTTLITTPKAVNANSYATLQEADDYHQTHLYATEWLAADEQIRETALIWATRLLDEQVQWNGNVRTFTQALLWPRIGVYKDGMGVRAGAQYYYPALLDADTIPTFLKNATAELARYLLIEDRTKERSIGLTSVKVDTVDVVFDKYDRKPIMPPSVVSIVQRYGEVRGPQNSTARLMRV